MTDVFFRNRLDQMIDLRHPLAVLANRIPWQEDRRLGFVWFSLGSCRWRRLQCWSASSAHPFDGGAAVPQACVQ
jgi:hypothetical protein